MAYVVWRVLRKKYLKVRSGVTLNSFMVGGTNYLCIRCCTMILSYYIVLIYLYYFGFAPVAVAYLMGLWCIFTWGDPRIGSRVVIFGFNKLL